MGRDWSRKSIEELIDDTVRTMIEEGTIDPGGGGKKIPDAYSPFNIPFTIESYSARSFASVSNIGIIRKAVFNSEGMPPDSRYYNETARPYGQFITSSGNNKNLFSIKQETSDHTYPMKYAYNMKPDYCFKISTPSSTTGMVIATGDFAGNDELPGYVLSNSVLLSPTSEREITSLPFYSNTQGVSVNSGARKVKTLLYVSSGSDIQGHNVVEVWEDFPVLSTFVIRGIPSTSVVSNLMSNIKISLTAGLGHLCTGYMLPSANDLNALNAFLSNLPSGSLYAFTCEIDDYNIAILTDHYHPENVIVNHVSKGWNI